MNDQTQMREHPHPGPLEYVKIAIVLVIITVVEVIVVYTPVRATMGLIAPVLLLLSALKFSLVALWYMHLKFDSRLFSSLFVGGIALTSALLVALMAMSGGQPGGG